jgi:hypothetical protein
VKNNNFAITSALIAAGTPVNDLADGMAPLHIAVKYAKEDKG